jgi:hypothetical protein
VTEQAKRAYEGYATSTGGKTFDGRDMPPWDALPGRIKEAWRAAVVAAVDTPPKPETLTDKRVRLLHETDTARVARELKKLLPPGQGFVLMTFDFAPGGSLAYVSNAHRDDTIRVLREWLQRQGAL